MFTNLGLVMSLCVILIETVASFYKHMCIRFPLKITAASADKSGFTSAAGLHTTFFFLASVANVQHQRHQDEHIFFSSCPHDNRTSVAWQVVDERTASFSYFVHVHQAVVVHQRESFIKINESEIERATKNQNMYVHQLLQLLAMEYPVCI